jgi:hypothetical protein
MLRARHRAAAGITAKLLGFGVRISDQKRAEDILERM